MPLTLRQRKIRNRRRRKTPNRRKIFGGAAIATDIIQDIKEDAREDVENAHLDTAINSMSDVVSDVSHRDKLEHEPTESDKKRIAVKEKAVATALNKISVSAKKEMLSVNKKIEKIFEGRVRDILPAFDKIIKESEEACNKKLVGLKKILDMLEKSKIDTNKYENMIRETIETTKAQISDINLAKMSDRKKIASIVDGLNGDDKIRHALKTEMVGGGILGVFDWLWQTFKFLVGVLVSTIYLLLYIAIVIMLFVATISIISFVWVDLTVMFGAITLVHKMH